MTSSQETVVETDKNTTSESPAVKPKKSRERGNRGGARNKGPQRSDKTRTFPVMKESISIDHGLVRGAFDLHFSGFRSAFFHVTSILGRFGMDEAAEQVHEYIIDLIDEAEKEIKKTTVAISQQIKQRGGPDVIPRTSPEQATRIAEVPSYVVRRYLNLFPAVDRLVDAIVCAESHGAIPWSRRKELLNDAPKYLRSPAGRFHSISTKLDARQSKDEKGLVKAKEEMLEMLEAVLLQHKQLKGIEEKHPLAESSVKTVDK